MRLSKEKSIMHKYIAVVRAYILEKSVMICPYAGKVLGLAQEIALSLLRVCCITGYKQVKVRFPQTK